MGDGDDVVTRLFGGGATCIAASDRVASGFDADGASFASAGERAQGGDYEQT